MVLFNPLIGLGQVEELDEQARTRPPRLSTSLVQPGFNQQLASLQGRPTSQTSVRPTPTTPTGSFDELLGRAGIESRSTRATPEQVNLAVLQRLGDTLNREQFITEGPFLDTPFDETLFHQELNRLQGVGPNATTPPTSSVAGQVDSTATAVTNQGEVDSAVQRALELNLPADLPDLVAPDSNVWYLASRGQLSYRSIAQLRQSLTDFIAAGHEYIRNFYGGEGPDGQPLTEEQLALTPEGALFDQQVQVYRNTINEILTLNDDVNAQLAGQEATTSQQNFEREQLEAAQISAEQAQSLEEFLAGIDPQFASIFGGGLLSGFLTGLPRQDADNILQSLIGLYESLVGQTTRDEQVRQSQELARSIGPLLLDRGLSEDQILALGALPPEDMVVLFLRLAEDRRQQQRRLFRAPNFLSTPFLQRGD